MGGDSGCGSVRERGNGGVNNCKIMNILLNKCGE